MYQAINAHVNSIFALPNHWRVVCLEASPTQFKAAIERNGVEIPYLEPAGGRLARSTFLRLIALCRASACAFLIRQFDVMSTTTPKHPPYSGDVSAHQAQTRRLVDAMMRLTGRSATALALSAGLTPSTLNRFMHRPVRHTLSQRTMLALMTQTFLSLKDRSRPTLDSAALAELAPAIPVYERGILEAAPEAQAALMEAKTATGTAITTPRTGTADLPVLLASNRMANIETGNFAQAPLKTERPPFLENDPRAFALLMPDESMVPRFDAGDMLYVSPARDLSGDKVDVVLQMKDGGFNVASLAGLSEDTLRVATLTPRARHTYERTKIAGAWRIVGVQRLGG